MTLEERLKWLEECIDKLQIDLENNGYSKWIYFNWVSLLQEAQLLRAEIAFGKRENNVRSEN